MFTSIGKASLDQWVVAIDAVDGLFAPQRRSPDIDCLLGSGALLERIAVTIDFDCPFSGEFSKLPQALTNWASGEPRIS